MSAKEEFISVYKENIKREGSDKLLNFLKERSDFFSAPASSRYHMAVEGGLVRHSLNVYSCLKEYVERDRVKNVYNLNPSEETVAIIALLHDVCKINCYKPGFRNVKDDEGRWMRVPSYTYEDLLPYGHGEKSVYIISGFMDLSREEAFAIRYHMGFSGSEDNRQVGDAFRLFPLAFALSTADMEATYFLENVQ